MLTNVDFEGPGMIADRATALGMEVRVHRLFDGEPVPPAPSIERLVVMGGPMSAFDDDVYPWLVEVRTRLTQLVEHATPVLGVCLGAQLLAASLGAAVYRGDEDEIGLGSVRLTVAARDDPLFGGVDDTEIDVFHWHGDTFDLPRAAVLLASSDRYANQAFRVGEAWGLQFHVELRPADADDVSRHVGDGRRVGRDELARVEPMGRRIIDAFLSRRRSPDIP